MFTKTKQYGLRAVALVLVIAILLFGGLSITGVAAQSAIPGDALYPVKTTIEQTRLSLAQNAGDRAQMNMAFAEKRLGEIDALIKEGRYREVNQAVLEFEANINSAILELETVSKADPARASKLALEITSALSRYALTLNGLAANAPDTVKSEVSRALDSAKTAGMLEMPSGNDNGIDDNMNANGNDNGADDNMNANGNDNGADDNMNANSNDNGADDSMNANGNENGADDNMNANGNDNGADDSMNANGNDNGVGNNTNTNGNDNGVGNNTNTNGNDNSGGNTNDNSGGGSGNDNGGGKSGKGG
jgi:hypothetical protein